MRSMALFVLVLLGETAAAVPLQEPPEVEFFEKKIRPVFAERCYSCHSAAAKKLKGALRLDTPEGILKGGERGPSVIPGLPEKSLLVQAVRHADDDLKMPPKGELALAQIADLEAWIRRGAAMPTSAPGAPPPPPSGRYWAFELPQDLPPPIVPGTEGIRNPIDAFILARLKENGLAPSPPADKRTLLRRATVDLLGLPPSPAEVEAFLLDRSPDAFAKVVDRLLASPHYGERWARHWLDVARYADTTDYDANGAVAGDVRLIQSALYRDWVIRALNEDLPYDQFLIQQIAGDLCDPKGPAEAMGFLTIGRRFAGNAHDTIDDRLDVIGRGILGLTLGCARCHDHKFDPIPTRDYYSLYGVFQASQEETVVLAAPREDYPEELKRRKDALRDFKKAKGEEVRRHLREKIGEYVAALGPDAAPAGFRELHPSLLGALRDFVAKGKLELRPGLTGEELLGRLSAFPPLSKPPEQLEDFFDIATAYEISYLKSKIARWEMAAGSAPSRAVVVEDIPPKGNPRVFKRGNPANPGEEVPRRFLEALSGAGREPFKQGSGRLELARALASPANPLTARVLVNRVWLHHFGEGLVRTPSDFGHRSEPPSHRELLDWLARRFVADGWSLKKLHRLILDSATYRQSAGDNPQARAIDPENRLLWRATPRRLDFESLRDSLLAVSGALDSTLGGPAEVMTSQPYSRRRAVYGFVDRLDVSNLLLAFDIANPASHSPRRHESTVPQQALFMMNSPFLLEQARRLASRPEIVAEHDPARRIQAFTRIVFGRRATEEEMALGRRFVDGSAAPKPPVHPAWQYGSGEVDETQGRTVNFRPLPFFTGEAWQCSPYLPDPDLGWIMLDATGGAPGDDAKHAVIRRWVAPCDGSIRVRGSVRLLYDADVYQGSVRARIVSSRCGLAIRRKVGRGEVPMEAALEVKTGDSIDFVVDCPEHVAYSRFGWAPAIEMKGGSAWSAEGGFGGPPEEPLGPWEAYAQVLLMSNEFAYVD